MSRPHNRKRCPCCHNETEMAHPEGQYDPNCIDCIAEDNDRALESFKRALERHGDGRKYIYPISYKR